MPPSCGGSVSRELVDSNVDWCGWARRCWLTATALLIVVATNASPARAIERLADIPGACSAAAEPGPDGPGTDALRGYWDDAVSYLAAPEHLNRALSVLVRISMCDTPSGETSLETVGIYSPEGVLTRCAVVVYPRGVEESSDETLTRASVTHEAFHCFMAALLGRDRINAVSGWLNEGAAAWVGETAVGGTPQSAFWWQSYLTQPRDALFGRTYSAIGFFAHLVERGSDVWHQLDDLFRADSGAKPTPAGMTADQYTFGLAVADRAGVIDSWPAGIARDSSFGADWDTTGPGITSDTYAASDLALGVSFDVPEASNDLATVDVEGDVIRLVVNTPSGHADGKLRAADGAELALDTRDYCARDGGCTCPGGGVLGTIAAGPALLALSGHVPTQAVPASGASVKIDALSLADYCVEGTPAPGPAPTGGAPSGAVPTSARVDTADCGPWFGSGWYVSFTLGTPGGDDFWIVQVIVEPRIYAGNGTYPEETDASSYGARVEVTRGNGRGYSPLVTAPDSGGIGSVSIGNDGRSGSAQVLLDDRAGGQIRTDYTWTCATVG
jgi:hypothetical protein